MEAFAFYLLKSAVWLSGFTIIYFLFLRNERFFLLKRLYLISGILVSFIFPLITIHYQIEVPAPVPAPDNPFPVTLNSTSGILAAADVTKFNFIHIITGLYLAGIIFLVIRTGFYFRHILRTVKKAKLSNHGPAKLIRTSEYTSSFSFFNYVFVNPSVSENEVEEIMNHEIVHVKQKHWFDLLLGEMLRIIQWANPLAWIYTGFIRLNHEYLADEVALQRTSNPAIYKAALLNQMFRAPVIRLSNPFNYSLNKKRFDMMKTIITSPYRKLKVLFVLPVFAIIFYAFAEPEYHNVAQADNIMEISQAPVINSQPVKGEVLKEDGSPLPGVTIVVSGTSGGVITDSSGKFAISSVPADAILTFSCKGYLTQSIKPKQGMDLVLHLAKDPEYKEGIIVVGYGDGSSAGKPVSVVRTSDGLPADVFVVIDGVEGNRKSLEAVHPDNISSVAVLKDRSATAVYGDKGRNGVIIVTTKQQSVVKGIVTNEEGKPLAGVNITSTGTTGNVFGATTGPDGRFSFSNLPSDASLLFYYRGCKPVTAKPDFTKEMVVKMERDPDYKGPEGPLQPAFQRPDPIVTVDGVLTDKKAEDVRKELGYNYGLMSRSRPVQGSDGAFISDTIRILTRKKALEMGLKPPFPRLAPGDYPTFQGQQLSTFSNWVISQLKYPKEAQDKNIEGWVSVNFRIELDGTLSNLQSTISVDPLLSDAVIKVIQSVPKWEPPANPDVNEVFSTGITLRFKLPDLIKAEAPFVVVEEMPVYPGGDGALLKYIGDNTRYPEEAKNQKITGRVIVRFVVSTDGKAEAISVLKGVHPLLDAEAIRIVSTLTGWQPGKQGGTPVNVWYMVPITFALSSPQPPK